MFQKTLCARESSTSILSLAVTSDIAIAFLILGGFGASGNELVCRRHPTGTGCAKSRTPEGQGRLSVSGSLRSPHRPQSPRRLPSSAPRSRSPREKRAVLRASEEHQRGWATTRSPRRVKWMTRELSERDSTSGADVVERHPVSRRNPRVNCGISNQPIHKDDPSTRERGWRPKETEAERGAPFFFSIFFHSFILSFFHFFHFSFFSFFIFFHFFHFFHFFIFSFFSFFFIFSFFHFFSFFSFFSFFHFFHFSHFFILLFSFKKKIPLAPPLPPAPPKTSLFLF